MDTSIESYFQFMPREILMDTILKDFTESELIPLSLVCQSFWQLFSGDKLHFVLEEFSPLTVPLIKFFEETKLKDDIIEYCCPAAAMHGDLELLQWARSNDYPWSVTSILAAKYGQLKVLQWAINNGCSPFDDLVMKSAAKKGHLNIIRYLFNEGCYWSESCALLAAKKGHIEIIKWAYHVIGISPKCVYIIAEKGNFEFIKWIKSTRTSFYDNSMCNGAAKGGHMEILQWLLNKGAMWNQTISKILVTQGELSMLKWAYDRGYAFHKKIYNDALIRDDAEMIQWLESIGYP